MTPRRHLVVFVKAPRLGAVKTRLAAEAGALEAVRFYRETTTRIVRRLGRDPRWQCWLAVTPDAAVRGRGLWPSGPPVLAQGRGDLGARMARPLKRLGRGPVVIVGTDIPELTAAHIARAFGALAHHDAVFGPSPDGGYWLVGLRRRPPPPGLFRGVRWSTPDALGDTLAGLGGGYSVALLEELADVDDAADLARWQRRRRTASSQTGPSARSRRRGINSTKLHGR